MVALLLGTGLLTTTCGGDSPSVPAPTTPAPPPTPPPPPNRAPVAVGSIPAQTLTAGGQSVTVEVASRFSDPDGDQLTFRAMSGDAGVVRVLISEGGLILAPLAAGTTTVTVTATDPGGLSATQTLAVTVGTGNRPPTAVGAIPDQMLTAGGSAVTLELASHFSDPDGDPLTFRATPESTGVVRVVVDGGDLVLLPERGCWRQFERLAEQMRCLA